MQSVTRQQQGTAFVLEITPRHRHRRVSAKFALLSKGESLNHIKRSINIRDHVPGEDDDDDYPIHHFCRSQPLTGWLQTPSSSILDVLPSFCRAPKTERRNCSAFRSIFSLSSINRLLRRHHFHRQRRYSKFSFTKWCHNPQACGSGKMQFHRLGASHVQPHLKGGG